MITIYYTNLYVVVLVLFVELMVQLPKRGLGKSARC